MTGLVDHVELERLPVEIVAATDRGSLAPVLSGGDLVLQGLGVRGRPAPYGANIASSLIFDLDEDRVIASVEVLVPRPRWRSARTAAPAPAGARRGSLRVPGSTTEVFVYDLEPRFLVERGGTHLVIEVEPWPSAPVWVALSDRAHAVVAEGFLAGFVVNLR